jgi:hypothetical protein
MGLHESSIPSHRYSIKIIGLLLTVTVILAVAGLLIYISFSNQGQLGTANFIWVDHHPASDLPHVHVEGTVFNPSSSGARNAQLTTRIYDSKGTLLKTEITSLGDIPAGADKKVSIDVQYAGKADRCEVTLTWKPFGG